ncbi:exosome 3'-_5 exonuclease subunit ski4 (Csl4) [Hypoxylon texense]
MPFLYRYICDLLQRLEDESRKAEHKQTPSKAIVEAWFREHRSRLDAPDNDASAILSTLLPERRTDRVYNIQVARLESIIGKALFLGSSRVQELRRYQTPALGIDLADCIERILERTPNALGKNELTVEEIDDTLSRIAAGCRFSSPSVRALPKVQDANQSLANIYRRISPRDAKWFTRLVLKNYQPVAIDEHHVFRYYHFLLPQVMKVRDDITVAGDFLQRIHKSPNDQSAITSILKPCVGTKVGRQFWLKGRSIKHCLDMSRKRDMSCEQKIDGEYCQIHINLRKPSSPIQIFSKSGKDSTEDRAGLHEAHYYEHLMIVYFDVLMIDGESLLGVRHSERFKRLTELISCRTGYAELVRREAISFSQPSAASRLRDAFAKCIVSRGEGLVLKPDEPYFDFSRNRKPYSCCYIKLKKEYFQGLGDVGDFAVVGALYNAAKAKEYKRSNVKWTHFFIGCLENKEKARARTEKPRFKITNVIELSEAELSIVMTQCFPSSVPFDQNESITLDFGRRTDKRPTDIFEEPLVFDMRCFSFEKEPNTNFWSMRFPMVSKIHHDRTYLDTISFTELQELASAAREAPELEDSQEMREWISKLEEANPRGMSADATTQESTQSEKRASPVPSCESRQETESVLYLRDTEVSTRGPVTPPRLSRNDIVGRSVHRELLFNSASQKRSAPDTAMIARKQQKRSSTSPMQSCAGNKMADVSPSAGRIREPLSQIEANFSSQEQVAKSQSGLPADSAPGGTISLVDNNCGSSPTNPCQLTHNIANSASGSFHTSVSSLHSLHKCSLVEKCAFANCSFLLAPCIAQYAWLTENLFRDHGIDSFFVDPRSWSQAPTPRRSPCSQDESPRPTKRLPVRKICLVESRRRDATMAFVGQIEAAGLKRSNGDREWVGVYDWRLLEEISGVESKKRKPSEMDPWRKYYVGIT